MQELARKEKEAAEENERLEEVPIEPVMTVSSAVSTELLINLDTSPPPPLPHDQSCDSRSFINPSSPDMLGGDSTDILVPEKIDDAPLANSEPSSQYLSQELF